MCFALTVGYIHIVSGSFIVNHEQSLLNIHNHLLLIFLLPNCIVIKYLFELQLLALIFINKKMA